MADSAPAEDELAHGMQVEVPYVPAAQRTTKQIVEVIDDSIVVVGQARQKKRKRAKTDADAEAPTPSGEESGHTKKASSKAKLAAEPDAEAFDFASVPNILDDVPNGEDMRMKKKKKQKQVKGENSLLVISLTALTGPKRRQAVLWGLPCATEGS